MLAGDGAPTLTGGYAKVAVIDRAKRLGYTNVAGYDPFTMDVPVQFEAFATYNTGYQPRDLERDITYLDWMAGRGPLFTQSKIGRAAWGNPPLVTIRTLSKDRDTGLIPKTVQGLSWIISGIDWDSHPVRDRNGDRQRQTAVLHLTQWVPVPESTRVAQNGFKVFRTTKKWPTALDVIVNHTAVRQNDFVSLKLIMQCCREHGTNEVSWRKKLKPGTRIYIPANLFRLTTAESVLT